MSENKLTDKQIFEIDVLNKEKIILGNIDVNKLKRQLDSDFFEYRSIRVDPGQEPMRIDVFLVNRVENVTRNKMQKAVLSGAVLVNNAQVRPSFKVLPGQHIQCFFPKPHYENQLIEEDIPLDIRYEDDDVLVLHKPDGLIVHPGIGNYSGTLINGLAYYFRKTGAINKMSIKKIGAFERPWLVHRLDKNTTGLMVVAKNEQAVRHLSEQFFQHSIHRKYEALIWGEPEGDSGTVNKNLGRNPNNRLQMKAFPPDSGEGKWAVTHYKVLERMYYVSLIECQLETGRTHQIRVHMKSIGHPIFNDVKYGGDRIMKGTVFSKYKQFVYNAFELLPRHALHAKELGFIHPKTGKEMFFSAEKPDDFELCVDKWRRYVTAKKDLR